MKKHSDDLMGSLLSENWFAINSACNVLRVICFVGPAAVQLSNQKVPFSAIRNLPEMIRNTKTRYRVVRWINAMIRNDPQNLGKQVLLRQDIMSAIVESIYRDSDFLTNEVRLPIIVHD